VERPLLILLTDIILFLVILAALLVGFLGIAGLKALGMSPARIEILETMHFYGYLTVGGIFLLDMIGKIIIEAARKKPA